MQKSSHFQVVWLGGPPRLNNNIGSLRLNLKNLKKKIVCICKIWIRRMFINYKVLYEPKVKNIFKQKFCGNHFFNPIYDKLKKKRINLLWLNNLLWTWRCCQSEFWKEYLKIIQPIRIMGKTRFSHWTKLIWNLITQLDQFECNTQVVLHNPVLKF